MGSSGRARLHTVLLLLEMQLRSVRNGLQGQVGAQKGVAASPSPCGKQGAAPRPRSGGHL